MKILKTILLTAIAVVACSVVHSQVADLHEYAQSKVSAHDFDANFIGSDGNRAVYVEHIATRKTERAELVAYSMDRQELVRLVLIDGKDKDRRCYGGFVNGQYVDLLMADWKGNDMTLYRERRDLQTLQPAGERLVLADYKGTSGDNMGFRLSSSPNQSLLALLYYVGRENQPTEVQVGLYSRELEEYWKVDTKVRRTSMFFLTDSGEVALGGIDGEGCKITILDGENEVEHLIPTDELPQNAPEMQLARIAKGKIYIVGTQREESKILKGVNGTQVSVLFSLCHDTKTHNTTARYRSLTDQDRARICCEKDDYKWKKSDLKTVRFFSLNQTFADRDGCYAMMDQTWTVTMDGRLSTENRSGQVVMRVDDEGEIEWVRIFRMSQTGTASELPMVHYRWVMTDRGPMLVWAETKKSAEYADNEPVIGFVPFSTAGVLTAAIIDSDGNITRQHWPLAAKTGLQGRPTMMENGDWLLLLRGKTKGHLATLKVK